MEEKKENVEKLVRAHVIVEGRVQKAFYRMNALDEARDLGLTGWIKNIDDGTVEAVFEGPENRVKEMLLWCKEGPRLARVKNMKTEFGEPTSEFKDFRIIY